jgi:hypothetical protein
VATLAAARLREAVHSNDRIIVLARPAGGEPPSSGDLSLVEAGPDDGERYARDIGTDSPATFRARLSPATSCWLVQEDGRVLHATWTTTEGAWTRELRACLRPPRGDAYVFESFTRADARGRGAYPFALGALSARLGDRGVDRLWVGVEHLNVASLRAVTKAGFALVYEIPYRRLLGRLTIEPPPGSQPSTDRLRLDPVC